MGKRVCTVHHLWDLAVEYLQICWGGVFLVRTAACLYTHIGLAGEASCNANDDYLLLHVPASVLGVCGPSPVLPQPEEGRHDHRADKSWPVLLTETAVMMPKSRVCCFLAFF